MANQKSMPMLCYEFAMPRSIAGKYLSILTLMEMGFVAFLRERVRGFRVSRHVWLKLVFLISIMDGNRRARQR